MGLTVQDCEIFLFASNSLRKFLITVDLLSKPEAIIFLVPAILLSHIKNFPTCIPAKSKRSTATSLNEGIFTGVVINSKYQPHLHSLCASFLGMRPHSPRALFPDGLQA